MSLVFVACSSDDDNGGNGGNNTTTTSQNTNKNVVTSTSNQYIGRLEFPKVKGGNNIVVTHTTNDAYGVNYSYEWDIDKKSQRWTCYEMYGGYDVDGVERYEGHSGSGKLIADYDGNEDYPRDPLLHAMTTPQGEYYFDKDYFYGSGFDHGHICPSADRLYSSDANKQTFYLTNMQPQYNKFNANLWSKMEKLVRKVTPTAAGDTLYVCKGGTIDSEANILKRIDDKLIVPKYFFMALLLKKGDAYKGLAFWAENEDVNRYSDNLVKYAITIDKLEEKTGIDFFCNLPDDIENDAESRLALSVWGLSE